MKKLLIISILTLSVAVMTGCYYDTEELLYPGGVSCSGVAPSFSKDVQPIFQTKCSLSGCHNTGATNTGGALTNYTEIKAKAAPCKTSVLNGSMPKGLTLTADQIKIISCWVDNGSQNN